MPAADLSGIIKAYDVRGVVPVNFDARIARSLGKGFAELILNEGGAGQGVVVGRDMRETGPALVDAFADGILSTGVDVQDVGLCSTDELYFASGRMNAAGAMFTASHNPARYNGIKLCRAGARPVGQDTGLVGVRRRAEEILDAGGTGFPDEFVRVGTRRSVEILRDYAVLLRALVNLSDIRPLRVVVDAGSGMAGLTVPAVLGTAAGLDELPIDIFPMYFELDGTFPHHEANPIVPGNTADLQREVVRLGADIGLAFDGDADRCFVVDERGERVDPSVLTALVGLRESRREQQVGRTPVVLHNLITSRAVPEIFERAGVRTIRTRVGHSFIKALMAKEAAVFGGEHSGHFYFRDFFGADSGLLAAMHVLAAVAEQDGPLSKLAAELDPYHRSGEINLRADDISSAERAVIDALGADLPRSGIELDRLDGLTLTHGDSASSAADDERWWVSLRPSNTEPLLRLNIEADTAERVDRLRRLIIASVPQH
ncbi:phosphomannomutase/phosphoglucomutase [Microbacterium sp.]|uniref:phosphomannomutase/phosphoglucomutase n=1 Tax=Microbacterium sp. TaxID=51671 RepID=UPI003F94EA8B